MRLPSASPLTVFVLRCEPVLAAEHKHDLGDRRGVGSSQRGVVGGRNSIRLVETDDDGRPRGQLCCSTSVWWSGSYVESQALMACGYQMAKTAYTRDLSNLVELADEPVHSHWVFSEMLEEITSPAANTPARQKRLAELRKGSQAHF